MTSTAQPAGTAGVHDVSDDIEVRIDFHGTPEPGLRRSVEQSVRAMAARSARSTEERRALEARDREVASLADEATARLIASDPDAAAKMAEFLARPLGPESFPLSEVTPRVVGASPPYDYHWSWHVADGAAPATQLIEDAKGHAALLARSGQGGAGKFVNAHAGFGIAFHAGGTRTVKADSQRRATHGYVVGAKGLGANATAEGGLECTFFENGQFKKGDSRRLYRRRASVNETFVVNPGVWVVDPPMPLEFPVVAGRDYNFNVGVWAYSDNTSGAGVSTASSVCQVLVQSMWVI
jgi:hypothetical protein